MITLRRIIAFFVFVFVLAVVLSESVIADGVKNVNICFYMIGGDLERDFGAGSADILEILRSEVPQNVHIFLLTGGAEEWRIPQLNGGTVFSKLKRQENGILAWNSREVWNESNIAAGETLKTFLNRSTEENPGAETMLVLWGHGGGGISGIGDAEGHMLPLSEIRQALQETSAKVSLIGMDACAMASLESGWMLDGTAELLIASTGTEPVSGWPHQAWLTMTESGAAANAGRIAEKIRISLERKTKESGILVIKLSGFRERNRDRLLELFGKVIYPGERRMISELTGTKEEDFLIGNWDAEKCGEAKALDEIGEAYVHWMTSGK